MAITTKEELIRRYPKLMAEIRQEAMVQAVDLLAHDGNAFSLRSLFGGEKTESDSLSLIESAQARQEAQDAKKMVQDWLRSDSRQNLDSPEAQDVRKAVQDWLGTHSGRQ